MKEAELSLSLFEAADSDPEIALIAWQGTGAKSYIARKVVFRLPSGRRMLPDLVLRLDHLLWIIEAKGSHAESKRDDEPKLVELRSAVSEEFVLRMVQLHGGYPTAGLVPVYAVAYSTGLPDLDCVPDIAHIAWADAIGRASLTETLRSLV